MTDNSDLILMEIKSLSAKLYGENGFEGDIPEIKKNLRNHSKRIRIIELALVGISVVGGGSAGIIKLFGG